MSKAQSWHFIVMFAGMQGIEIGDAINAKDHGFAINRRALVATGSRHI
jgi:hypothetical protein